MKTLGVGQGAGGMRGGMGPGVALYSRVFEKYQVMSIPRTLIIDKKGIIRADVEGSMDFNEFRNELKKVGL